jgi:hypothetical protein
MRTPGEVLIGMFSRINAGLFCGDEITGAMLILLMRLRVLFYTNTVTEFQFDCAGRRECLGGVMVFCI